ncbi:hypothetical protein [Maple mottle-associated virus]|uniref:Uncharacterized protein n=1 Tax=Maple mottle-associated virus TaxID=2778521 RepID=A0A7L8Y984_9VIRU|nr:hypothetical protein QK757_sRNA6gp1 [Maple mottle-associated virus]QOI17320.1 hypothetical protein [Maple mottle-associated virus]
MELKSFENSYRVIKISDLKTHYDELEKQLFYSVIETLKNEVEYDEMVVIRDSYNDNYLDLSELTYQTISIIHEGTKITQKTIRQFLRYLQITYSLLGITDVLGSELNKDFHIFGTSIQGTKMYPYIPDRSQYLLMTIIAVKKIIEMVVKGMDPITAIRQAHFIQPSEAILTEGTVAYTFHLRAIAYISLRFSMRTENERRDDNFQISPLKSGKLTSVYDPVAIDMEHFSID